MQEILEEVAEFINQCLGPLGSDGFTWETVRDFLIQICATLILFLVVKFFLWNKVTDFLEAKRALTDDAVEKANEARNNAMELEASMKEKLLAAEEEIRHILAQAEIDANNTKDRIITEAKEEAKRRLANAKDEINNEILEKNADIKQIIVDVAFCAAKKIIADEIDQDRYLDVINHIIEEAAE